MTKFNNDILNCEPSNSNFVGFVNLLVKDFQKIENIDDDDLEEVAFHLTDIYFDSLVSLFPGKTMNERDFSNAYGSYSYIFPEIYNVLFNIWSKNEMEDFPHESMKHTWTKKELFSDIKPLLNKLLVLQKKLSS